MGYRNPRGKSADKYRAYLRSKGWKQSTLTILGIAHEAWINPATKNTQLLQGAIMSQRKTDRKSQSKQAEK